MNSIADILGIPRKKMQELENMMEGLGFEPALDKVAEENEELIKGALIALGVKDRNAEDVFAALLKKAERDEEQLYSYIGITKEDFDTSTDSTNSLQTGSAQAFQKIADTAKDIATEKEGFFLKKEFGEQILREREPEAILEHLGHSTIDELLAKEDITEIFSALRFTETDEWMHKTFEVAYTKFTPNDFEHRPIEIKVLGPQWEKVAKKYVAKKHHNVSHLKEFGVIFLNPIAQTGTGKFVRDFALLLHYFHEIAFYSKLFATYSETPDFNQKFISLLRGDVLEKAELGEGEWLIVQRYLWKENPQDPRLFLPHVNPEAMHWRKAEQDLVRFGRKYEEIGLEFWDNFWSVAGFFLTEQGKQELISFDLEDNAMMVAHKEEGKDIRLSYHQHEALWNRIFATYVGDYGHLEDHIMRNIDTGSINLQPSFV